MSEPLFGYAAEFDSPESLEAAARAVAERGYTRVEAFSPMAIEGLAETLGAPPSRVPRVVLACAILGGLTGYGMQWFAYVIDYPMNVGGKPDNAWPMFMPVTFELSVLFAAFGAIGAMLFFNRLPRLSHPMFRVADFRRASRDRFFLCIEAKDARFDPERTRDALAELKPLAVREVR